ncbi:MAG TPA: hypothetical protein VES61_08300 [Gaiellaceae bacterium]|nr:hypothetical protein [Gaiellaceae bacterium]
MRNGKAIGAVLIGLLALGVLGGGIWAIVLGDIQLVEAVAALPVSALLALVALSLGGHARAANQRSLGQIGGEAPARLGRFLGGLALLLAFTACLAVGVFAVLVLFG